jgi:zinc protease
MGFLLEALSPEKVDGQRDVVKNERRFRVENRPYGGAFIALGSTCTDRHTHTAGRLLDRWRI